MWLGPYPVVPDGPSLLALLVLVGIALFVVIYKRWLRSNDHSPLPPSNMPTPGADRESAGADEGSPVPMAEERPTPPPTTTLLLPSETEAILQSIERHLGNIARSIHSLEAHVEKGLERSDVRLDRSSSTVVSQPTVAPVAPIVPSVPRMEEAEQEALDLANRLIGAGGNTEGSEAQLSLFHVIKAAEGTFSATDLRFHLTSSLLEDEMSDLIGIKSDGDKVIVIPGFRVLRNTKTRVTAFLSGDLGLLFEYERATKVHLKSCAILVRDSTSYKVCNRGILAGPPHSEQ